MPIKTRRLLLAGGGTGGHIFAAQAIAEEFLETPGSEVLFVGAKRGLESRIIPQKGLPLKLLYIGPLKGGSVFSKIFYLLQVPVAFIQSFFILLSFRPGYVVGVGGYAGGPVVLLARIMSFFTKTKVGILEQNSVPGLTNRILSKFAKRIYLNFEDSFSHFDFDKCLWVGNPVRKDLIQNENPSETPPKKKLLVFGGSQGAQGLNQLVIFSLGAYEPLRQSLIDGKWELVHQTGPRLLEQCLQEYKKLDLLQCRNISLMPFIDDMTEAYKGADLVVSRAGASTLAELAIVKKPSILVPLPTAADGHQEKNARVLEKDGAALLWLQGEKDPEETGKLLYDLLFDDKRLTEMSEKVAHFAKPNAAKAIVSDLLGI